MSEEITLCSACVFSATTKKRIRLHFGVMTTPYIYIYTYTCITFKIVTIRKQLSIKARQAMVENSVFKCVIDSQCTCACIIIFFLS